jgi:UDP-N-acetylmuramoyl-L-alanyl-D-glutamate--2,6-diaminopimelate ligase
LVHERLKSTGRAVLNLDDAQVAILRSRASVGFSAQGHTSEVSLQSQAMDRDGIRMRVRVLDEDWEIRSPLVGGFNVENLLAAVAVGVALGVPKTVVAQGLAAVGTVPGRLERVSTPEQPLVLVDYAHTPDALDKALAAARAVTQGRLICVFGCGGDRDPGKRAPMGEAAGRGADVAVLTSDNPRTEQPEQIAAAVRVGLEKVGRPYEVELDRARAIALAVGMARADDTVLIAGKGHETYQIIGQKRRDFDDRVEARSALRSWPAEGSA